MRWLMSLVALITLLSAHTASAQDVTDRGAAARAWINDFRAEAGRGPLTVDATLTQTAALHARDMARRGFFSHSGSDGSSIADRARRAGYRFCFIAENIAKGQADLRAVLQSWAKSKGHRANMLSREAQGFALVEAPGRIWVMVLGRDGC